MKTIEVRVPHSLPQDDVRSRIEAALDKARTQYAETVGTIDAQWESPYRLRVLLQVTGMKFDGTVEILVGEVLVAVQVPGMAALFSGRIREGIEERLGGLIGSHQG